MIADIPRNITLLTSTTQDGTRNSRQAGQCYMQQSCRAVAVCILPIVKYKIMGLATEYGLNGVQCGLSVIKESVWLCFKQKVQF